MRKLSLREVQLMQLELMRIVDEFCLKNNIRYYLIAGSCLGAIRHGGFIPWDDDIDIALMRDDYDRFIDLFGRSCEHGKYSIQNYFTDSHFVPALSRICIEGTYMDIPSERHLKNRKNTYIDIFPLDNVPDDLKNRKRQKNSLKIIDFLMNLKQYHVYRGTLSERLIKRIVSLMLTVLPLKFLQRVRYRIMTEYSSVETSCVCSTTSKYGYDKQIIDRAVYGEPVRTMFDGIEVNIPRQTETYLRILYGSNYMQLPPEEKRVRPQEVYIGK